VKRPRNAAEGKAAIAKAAKAWSDGDREEAVALASACGPWLDEAQWKAWQKRLDACRGGETADLIARQIFGAMVQHDFTWLRVLRHWALSEKPARRRAAVLAVLGRVRRMQDGEAGDSILEAFRGETDERVLEALAELKSARAALGG
jgi:hypothetical protein